MADNKLKRVSLVPHTTDPKLQAKKSSRVALPPGPAPHFQARLEAHFARQAAEKAAAEAALAAAVAALPDPAPVETPAPAPVDAEKA